MDPSGIIAAYDQPPHSNCAIARHPKMRPLPALPESSATNPVTMQYNGLYACQTRGPGQRSVKKVPGPFALADVRSFSFFFTLSDTLS